ncbi:MAG: radical SAM protein [Phycisphaeraceae bacterium]
MSRPQNDLARALDIEAVIDGTRRLAPDEALRLYHEAPMHELGRWAAARAEQIHGPDVRTYIIDRNINYTNVCSAHCTFCAFRRDEDDHDAYLLSKKQLRDKMQELSDIGGTQVLLQGGMHPGLPLSFYEDMLADLKSAFPHIHIHGFSPPEFVEFVAVFDIEGFPKTDPKKSHELPHDVWLAKLETIMKRLMDAGLDSIPGGGGEIFAEAIRDRIGLGKATAEQWLEVMSVGHKLGMFTSATMMFGHIEGVADRIDHMRRVRDWQDHAIAENYPGRYVSFISWPFQRENTPLGRVPDWDPTCGEPFAGDVLAEKVYAGAVDPTDRKACANAVPAFGKTVRMAGASEYLRMQAISRLFLDNIHSIGSSWVTMGPKIGQLGLFYGANDMGSVMMEENVVSAAGTTYCLDEPVLCKLIRESGFTPAQRDNRYQFIKVHDGDDAPDRQVTDWSRHRAKQLHIEQGSQPGDEGDTVPLTIGSED